MIIEQNLIAQQISQIKKLTLKHRNQKENKIENKWMKFNVFQTQINCSRFQFFFFAYQFYKTHHHPSVKSFSENMKSSQEKVQLSASNFDVVRELGFGSFGKVYLVRHKDTKQQYAMKSISLSKVGQKEKDAALNEIRLLASISIPNVVQYEGSFYNADDQTLCIVMEYADGGDLEHKITEKQNLMRYDHSGMGFDEKYIWKVAYQVLSGLKTLHDNKIIHRDIKSANIFFVKGIAKLGDLNISKITDNGFCSTQTGTPYYTSPEIWKGELYNSKCDIWSLGCIIYEMAALRPPFKANDFPSLYKNILAGDYPEIASGYSEDLKLFIKMCLTVNTNRRPSAAQLLETRILSGMELCLENFDKSQGQINLIDPIQCPKVLRFLNSKLPQPQKPTIMEKKKTVLFVSKQIGDEEEEKEKSQAMKLKVRKIRSQKVINFGSQKQTPLQGLKSTSKKNIKLPPLQHDTSNLTKESTQITSMKKLDMAKSTVKPTTFTIKKNQPAKSMKCINIQGKENSSKYLVL